MVITPVDFVAAVNRQLPESGLLADGGLKFVVATLVSGAAAWPVTIEVKFRDPGGDTYVWDAGAYTYVGIPGFAEGDSLEDSEFLVNDWCSVAAANISEWVEVRDREEWQTVRPAPC